MSYSRRTVTDGITVMNKDLYDNLQDGIDEAKEDISKVQTTVDDLEKKVEELTTGKTMTIRLDFSVSDPTRWALYDDDALEMEEGSSEWDKFFGISEVLLKDGQVVATLDPDNLAQDINGNPVDIVDGTMGDVFTRFPRIGYKVSVSGSVVTISLNNSKTDQEGFCYYAHTYKGKKCSAFYRGCFKGDLDGNNKLRSLSGKIPANNYTIGSFRQFAQNNGDGYEQSAFYQLSLLQMMYLLKYKGANAQDTENGIGLGSVTYNSSGKHTGETVAKGRDWGGSGDYSMCFLNQEDFYGSLYEWIDGIVTGPNREYMVINPYATTEFNDAGTDYRKVSKSLSEDASGYISFVVGTKDACFLPTNFGGSASTYLCDASYRYASKAARFGGYYSSSTEAGPFYIVFIDDSSHTESVFGSRLMFFEVQSD